MDRFPTPQPHDRTHGPAPFAPGDGLAQGMIYTAVIQSAPSSEGTVQVTVPALHLSQSLVAHIQPGTVCNVGETCCVAFDEKKIPWVVTGLWPAVSLSVLTAALVTAEGKITVNEAHIVALEAKLADSGWVAPSLLNSWAGANIAYRKQGNTVRLRGEATTKGTSGSTAFELPSGFRPPKEAQYPGVQSEAHGVAHVRVAATGKVEVFYDGGASLFLDGITFTID